MRSRMITRQLALVIVACAGAVLCLPPDAWAACAAPVARIVSIDNSVQLKDAGGTAYVPAALDASVCQGDSIRVGEFSRATIAFVDSGLRLTIEQNTEFTVRPPRRAGRSFIDLLRGAILFITRQPRPVDVRTPFVNAAVEGTEFLVRVDDDRTEVAVLEGAVSMVNDQGRLTLTSGQSGQAFAGQAPQRVDVRPLDAARWALYYEPVFPPVSLQELERVPSAEKNARYFVRRAGVLLGAGRVDEARADLARARQMDANDSDAYALSAIIDVAQNNRDAALDSARRAVSLAPQSVPARLALSYALQASFDLEAARDALLEVVPRDPGPEHAPALARLAELWLSLGYVGEALDAANTAVSLAPDFARARTVLGFVELARLDTSAARASFERATELESSNPLARFGLGLARIREGDLHGGRHDIETAAALDVDDAVIRSYLGKAYFEEKRDAASAAQFELAKQHDPRDPTPYLYDAIRKQTINRPVEALQDLQKSIELNDNRAIYRSRFLLDADLAARSASLARIYRDVGFEQRALVEGRQSVATDPGDYSGHRFLADIYSALPRHEVARVSELLQALLLQPINITPVPVGLSETGLFILEGAGPAETAFNEFNPLFNRNRVAVQASGTVGQESVFGDEITASGVWNRWSFSVGQFHYDTDGFRVNNQQDRDLYNTFVQTRLSHATSVQAEFRSERTSSGDLIVNFDASDFSPDRAIRQETNTARFGLKHEFNSKSQLIGSLYWQGQDLSFSETTGVEGITATDRSLRDTRGVTAEVRHLFRGRRFRLTSGLGRFQSERKRDEVQEFQFPPPFPPLIVSNQFTDNPEQTNAYGYAQIDLPRHVVLTVGASADFFRREFVRRNQFNPKVGVVWTPVSSTTVRVAALRTLNRTVVSNQTIEPTQVAGFSQLFADGEAEEARQYGAGVDHRFSTVLFGGAEFIRRDLSIPVEFVDETTRTVVFVPRTDQFGRSYLYVVPDKHVSLTLEYFFEDLDHREFSGDEAFLEARTHRVALGTHYFHESGVMARLKAVHISQDGSFLVRGVPTSGTDGFWVFDAGLGYRLPNRLGRLMLEFRNLFDASFRYQDTDPANPRFRSGRLAVFKFVVGV
jgi:tetratricopeptide (TPR) repeat protein